MKFDKVKYQPAVNEHLTPKKYVDTSIDETSVVRDNEDFDFDILNLTKINRITPKTQAVNDNQVITKSYVDQFHQENERSGWDVGLDFYDEWNDLVTNNQDNKFDINKATNLDSVSVIRNPSSDNDLANRKYVDDLICAGNVLVFIQTLEKYFKVFVVNDTYNLNKCDKIQTADTSNNETGKSGGYVIQNVVIECNDKKAMVKYKTSLNQQKRTTQRVDQEQRVYHQ